jgi:FkbM family methyltransferase
MTSVCDSYSQFGEDLIIAKWFADTCGDSSHVAGDPCTGGNLIDVGAYEPADMSNSRLLIERGWDATLIEFSPMAVKNLATEYGGNEHVRVVQAALTVCDQGMQEFRVTDDGLSSNDPEHLSKWKEWTDERGSYYGKLFVPTVSVGKLMDQFYCNKPLHFVNIDTEGTSVDVAVEFMKLLGGWRPRVLCVEYDMRLAELVQVAQALGYRQEWISEANVVLVAR